MSSSEEKESKPATTAHAPTSTVVERSLTALADSAHCPKQLSPYLKKAAPIIGEIIDAGEKAVPYIQKAYEVGQVYYEKLKPYRLELLLPSVAGLIMCFFGGSYLTVIAAWEAFMMCGYESTKRCVVMLYEDLVKVYEANKKDDTKDDDNDGVPDVLQVSQQELLKRKVFLFLRLVEPERITTAIAGINAGFLAVVATLKLQFARTITLGNSIGEQLEVPAKQYVLPVVVKLLPEEHRKWAWPLISYGIRSIAISVAWFIQRVVSSFHSALRGGIMFSRNILHYLDAMNIIKINHEETYLDEAIGYGLAALGLFFQLSLGFAVPFPLNILLFPVTMVEYFLVWTVSSK
jgi:hypothetical protein